MIKKGLEPDFSKPKLDDFFMAFQAKIKEMNKTYKNSKQEFENDLKFFKNCDVEDKENTTTHNNSSSTPHFSKFKKIEEATEEENK